jgi:hypothetical protein
LAQQYADLWRAQMKLYRVPFVHIVSAPWGEGQIHFICQIDPKPEAAGQRLGEDIVQNPNPHMWIPYNGPEPYDVLFPFRRRMADNAYCLMGAG